MFFFHTNPDLAVILGDMHCDFENFHFLHFFGSQISRSHFQISRFPGSHISRLPEAAATPDELSDPNLTTLPTHPGIKYVARSPCCDIYEYITAAHGARSGVYVDKQTPGRWTDGLKGRWKGGTKSTIVQWKSHLFNKTCTKNKKIIRRYVSAKMFLGVLFHIFSYVFRQ